MYGIVYAEREFINKKWTKLHVWYLGIILGQYGTRLWGFLGPRPDPGDLKNCKFIMYSIDYAERKFINKKWTKLHVWYLGIILGQYGTHLWCFQGPRPDPGISKCANLLCMVQTMPRMNLLTKSVPNYMYCMILGNDFGTIWDPFMGFSGPYTGSRGPQKV